MSLSPSKDVKHLFLYAITDRFGSNYPAQGKKNRSFKNTFNNTPLSLVFILIKTSPVSDLQSYVQSPGNIDKMLLYPK